MAEEKYKILIVDDDEDVLETMADAMGEFKQKVILARDGEEAVNVALAEKPHIIVLDLMLPKRGGFLVLQKLKGKPRQGKVPLVCMVTGNEGARHMAFAQSLGVDDYLRKPFPMFRLTECVSKYLEKLKKMASTEW